jgi:hypothetical protein
LSYWFHKLDLPAEAKEALKNNIEVAYRRGLLAFNEKRTKRIKAENAQTYKEASKEIPSLSKTELMLIGAALYWGEGVNKIPERGYQAVAFTNSNPLMIKIFLRYLREVLKISDEKMKPGVIVHPNISPEEAKEYWAKVTNLAKEKFWFSIGISRASKRKMPINSLPYGTAHLRVYDRKLFYRVQGQIAGIAKQI